MKKTLLLSLLILAALFLKAQPFAAGGLGHSISNPSLVGEVNVGYKSPFSECREYKTPFEGLMVAGGIITSIDGGEPPVFNVRAGKSFYLDYASELEFTAGYAYQLVSNDDKSRNASGPVYYLSYIKNISIGAWVISASKTGKFTSASIGLRFYFGAN